MPERSWLDEREVLAIGSPLARSVELHGEIGSTQARARELAKDGAPDGTLVVSRIQTGGRGRLGRLWGSPAGGLWMSLVLRPDFEARLAGRITQAAAVGVAKALRSLGVKAEIKWPNDILVGGRKICGILAESSLAAGGGVGFVVLGVGMNANLDVEELGVEDGQATTLRRELGRDVGTAEILASVLDGLEREFGRIGVFGGILEDWKSMNCTLGRRVRVVRSGETLEGEAVDITGSGALVLRTGNGFVELFEGEVENLRAKPL
ncbi:MAG: biotin--[acetyl-CoA-carboxylase] ligase [Rubrobacteraceae bacterium]|nr:biotin--[acetyl-CoA-carboxylase] ligase [Rubrobacter sp.]